MPKPSLSKMTKAELIELARKRKVAIKTSMLKAEILVLLEKHEKSTARAKKKVTAKTAAGKGKKTPVKKAAPAAKKSPAAKKAKPKIAKPAAAKTQKAAAKKAVAKKPAKPAGKTALFSPWPRAAEQKPAADVASSVGLPHGEIELEDKAQEAKFIVGSADHHEPWEETHQELPARYGDHRLVLLARDPYWVHLFWELDPGKIDEGLASLGCSIETVRCVLRIHPQSEGAGSVFDVDVDFRTGRHYLELSPPGASFFAEIGMTAPNGRFYCLARSNSVTLPRDKPSDRIDERWMTTDEEFERIYLLSGGREGNGLSGSESIVKHEHKARQWTLEFPTSPVGSHGSAFLGGERQKEFRFWLDAELVVYGGADAGSRIELAGKAVDTRPDGTFTVRLALPDGPLHIPVRFVSPDGEESHSADVDVTRKTRIEQDVPDWQLY